MSIYSKTVLILLIMAALNFLYIVAPPPIPSQSQPPIPPQSQPPIPPQSQPEQQQHGQCCWLKPNGVCAQYTKTGRCRGRPAKL